MLYKTEINRNVVYYVFAEIHNPQQMLKIQFSLSRHISAEEPREKHADCKMRSTEFLYVFAEIQNPRQMLKIEFP